MSVGSATWRDEQDTSPVTVWDSMDRKTYLSQTRCWEGLLFILTCLSLSLRFLEVAEWRMNKRFPWEKPSPKRDFHYHQSPRRWWGRLSISPHRFFVVFFVFLHISLHITFYKTNVLFYFYAFILMKVTKNTISRSIKEDCVHLSTQ